MKKIVGELFSLKSKLPTVLILSGMIGILALNDANALERKTFTIEKPSDYITFNSIIDSPYGDERNFVRIKEADSPNSYYTDELEIVAGKEYEVYTFFHNNSANNLNLVAKDTKMKVFIPDEIKAGQKLRIDSQISASNANPDKVYDNVYIWAESDVVLRYVPDSAVLNSKHAQNLAISFEEMTKKGSLIGSYKADGLVKGGNEYSGNVIYRFKAVKPDFTVQKQVRKIGAKNWTDELKDLKAGETVEYRVIYTNTGDVVQNNVHLKSALPKGLSYVDGSAEFRNSRTKTWTKLSAEAEKQFKKTGFVKLGDYAPKSNASIRYRLKLEGADKMKTNNNTYTDTVSVITQNGTRQASSKITAHKIQNINKNSGSKIKKNK